MTAYASSVVASSNRHEIGCRTCSHPGERSCATARRLERELKALGLDPATELTTRRTLGATWAVRA